MANAPPPSKKRMYTFVCVFYGTHNELIPFLKLAKHWFFILHDKDETDPHYHIYCTFATNKSFASVRNLMISPSTILVQEPLGTPLDNRDYFLHSPGEQYHDKYHYPPESLNYDSPSYWARVFSDDSLPNERNEEFIKDLLFPSMRLEDMAVKYGRDFIKNAEKYVFFRSAVLNERRIDLRNDINGVSKENIYNKAYIK